MSTNEPIEPSGTDTQAGVAKPWWKRWWGIAAIAFVVLMVIGGLLDTGDDAAEDAAAAGADTAEETGSESEPEAEPESGSDSEDESSDRPDWAEIYGHFNVLPTTFVDRWNEAVNEIGHGLTLEPFVFDREQYFLPAAKQEADWVEIEVVEHPEGPLMQVFLYGEPRGADEGTDLIAMVIALIYASTDVDLEEALTFAQEELKLNEDDIDADAHWEEASLNGVLFEADAFSGMWDFFATRERD